MVAVVAVVAGSAAMGAGDMHAHVDGMGSVSLEVLIRVGVVLGHTGVPRGLLVGRGGRGASNVHFLTTGVGGAGREKGEIRMAAKASLRYIHALAYL